jgi:rubrerythrin
MSEPFNYTEDETEELVKKVAEIYSRSQIYVCRECLGSSSKRWYRVPSKSNPPHCPLCDGTVFFHLGEASEDVEGSFKWFMERVRKEAEK